jgi:hypothetical protein
MSFAQRVVARYLMATSAAPIVLKFVERAYRKHKAKIDETIHAYPVPNQADAAH